MEHYKSLGLTRLQESINSKKETRSDIPQAAGFISDSPSVMSIRSGKSITSQMSIKSLMTPSRTPQRKFSSAGRQLLSKLINKK